MLVSAASLSAAYYSHGGDEVDTVSGSQGGYASSVTMSYDDETGILSWTRNYSYTAGGAGGPAEYAYITTGVGGGATGAMIFDGGHGSASGTSTGSTPIAAGTWILFVARIVTYDGADVHDFKGYFQAGVTGPPPTFSITFKIPEVPTAANGGAVVHYKILNADGEEVASYDAQPGDPESDLVLAGLESEGELTLAKQDGHAELVNNPVSGLAEVVFVPSGVMVPISSGVPSVGSGTTVAAPPAPPPNNPAPPAPPPVVPNTPPPTPSPSAPIPTPSGPVSGIPSPLLLPRGNGGAGTGGTNDTNGATTASVAAVENAIVESRNAIVDSVEKAANAQIDAINNAAESNTEGHNAVVDAVNTAAAASNEATNALGRNIKGVEYAINGPAGIDAVEGFPSSSETQLDNLDPTGVTGTVLGKFPTSAPTITKPTAVSTITWTLYVPRMGASNLELSKTVDFGASPFATPITIFRTVLQGVLAILFFVLGVNTLRSAFTSGK